MDDPIIAEAVTGPVREKIKEYYKNWDSANNYDIWQVIFDTSQNIHVDIQGPFSFQTEAQQRKYCANLLQQHATALRQTYQSSCVYSSERPIILDIQVGGSLPKRQFLTVDITH